MEKIKLAFATIVINEQQFILKNLCQHYKWKNADVKQWIIIEGVDPDYPTGNITPYGLSTDNTEKSIKAFNDYDDKITYIQKGFADKRTLRNEYLKYIRDDISYLISIDADEFYPQSQQEKITNFLELNPQMYSVLTDIRNLWHDYDKEIIGSYFRVPHLKIFKWQNGCSYLNNHIQLVKGRLNYNVRSKKTLAKCDAYMVHFGFARRQKEYSDKIQYYINRGEKTTRPRYVECRNAWYGWKPNMPMPYDLKVIKYDGELPEVFLGL